MRAIFILFKKHKFSLLFYIIPACYLLANSLNYPYENREIIALSLFLLFLGFAIVYIFENRDDKRVKAFIDRWF